MTGTLMSGLSSLLCGFAGTAAVLIAARAVQGVSAAVMAPTALSILLYTFEEGPDRNKALGFWSGSGGFGATAFGTSYTLSQYGQGVRCGGAGLGGRLRHSDGGLPDRRAFGVAVATSTTVTHIAGPDLTALTSGYQTAFTACAVLAVTGLSCAIVLLGARSRPSRSAGNRAAGPHRPADAHDLTRRVRS
ncbi:hypothetical protein [Streptomyces sp. SID13726]|uniref:hypothetical protein n=1 Tax=Streptomyces sp. SID13726 TaxID=2706058 RepID=UPI001EF380AA|nr:hypothetical protein [Streptomyces sp. SID13726]